MSDYIRKIVMLGNPAVGKTSLIRKYVDDMFEDKYLSTLGAKPTKKKGDGKQRKEERLS